MGSEPAAMMQKSKRIRSEPLLPITSNHVRAHKSTHTLHDIDLCAAGEHLQATGQLFDHGAFPVPQLVHIDRRRTEGNAVGAHGLGVLDHLRSMQEGLGGNAADIQANAPSTGQRSTSVTCMPRSAARKRRRVIHRP